MATVANMPEQAAAPMSIRVLREALAVLRGQVQDHEESLPYSTTRREVGTHLREAIGALKRAEAWLDEAVYWETESR